MICPTGDQGHRRMDTGSPSGCASREPRRAHASGAQPLGTVTINHWITSLLKGPRQAVAGRTTRRRPSFPGPSPEAQRPATNTMTGRPAAKERSPVVLTGPAKLAARDTAVSAFVACDASLFRQLSTFARHRLRSASEAAQGMESAVRSTLGRRALPNSAHASRSSNAPFSACSLRYAWKSPIL